MLTTDALHASWNASLCPTAHLSACSLDCLCILSGCLCCAAASSLLPSLVSGCELLKNLVLSGFQHITALDLDTIDVSNLNRQFLFRRVHVGQSKAAVAAAAVGAMVPAAAVSILPLHANIKSAEYNHDFFAGFDLVMNALDNLEARRHVNRLCLSAERTLLESGTQGYAGQTTVITGGVTECFECSPVPAAKTFAVCTIRNTPDKPVHTVVWAKSIYAALFGEEDEGNIMSDARMDLGEAVEKERSAAAADAAAATAGQPLSASRFSSFAREVFTKLFQTEIQKQCEIKERWKDRKPPVPLDLETLIASLNGPRSSTDTVAPPAPLPSPLTSAFFRSRDHSVFTTAENALFLLVTLRALLLERTSELGRLSFDKDDDLAMDFVSAASNLRMDNFGIGTLSRFAVKGIAGNIVHAIATTNAIAAGLMVVEALKILQGKRDQCHTSWITRKGPALLTAQTLSPPNPNCFVCANAMQERQLTLDTSVWTLRRLYATILKKDLSMNEPAIDVVNRDNFIGTEDDHAEEDEEAEEDAAASDAPKIPYLDRPLNSAGVRIDHGALLQVEDQSQKISVSLRIAHRPTAEWNEEETPEMYTLAAPRAPTAAAAASSPAVAAASESQEESKEQSNPNAKVSAPAAAGSGSVSHKRKSADVMEVLDDADADTDDAAATSVAKKAKADAQTPSSLLSAIALSLPAAPVEHSGSAAEDAIELE